MKLLAYFKQERDNQGPLLPLTAVQKRAADELGISLRTVTRIAQESVRLDINNQNTNTSVIEYGPRQKPKTEDVGETIKIEVRNVIYNMYSESRTGEERGDESDYYTPEEPAPTPGPLYENNTPSSIESTPQRLPGTPLSHVSTRSSAESYTSGSSTRNLLNNIPNAQIKS